MIHWIASYPRSGNTWVRMFLRAFLSGKCDINQRDKIVRSIHDVDAWQATCAMPVTNISFPLRVDYLPAVLRNMEFLNRPDKTFVKTHNAIMKFRPPSAQEERDVLPPYLSGKSVYIVRHPFDVVRSYADYEGVSIDQSIANLANPQFCLKLPGMEGATEYTSSWSANVTSWQKAPFPVIILKYEELLARPVDEFLEMVRFLGYDANRETVAWAVGLCELSKLKDQEQRDGYSEGLQKRGRFFGSAHRGLTKEQKFLIMDQHQEAMQIYGYVYR